MKIEPLHTRAAPKTISACPIRSRSIPVFRKVFPEGESTAPATELGAWARTVRAGGRARPVCHDEFHAGKVPIAGTSCTVPGLHD